MEGRKILEEIHKIGQETAALSSGIRAEIANIKEVAMGNYKKLAREVDEIRRDVTENKKEIAGRNEEFDIRAVAFLGCHANARFEMVG